MDVMVEIMEEVVLFSVMAAVEVVMVMEMMAERWCRRCGMEEVWDGLGRGMSSCAGDG